MKTQKISEALEDDKTGDVCKKSCCSLRFKRVWILVDVTYGKKAIEYNVGNLGVDEFEDLMKSRFQMSSWGVTVFLGLHVQDASNQLRPEAISQNLCLCQGFKYSKTSHMSVFKDFSDYALEQILGRKSQQEMTEYVAAEDDEAKVFGFKSMLTMGFNCMKQKSTLILKTNLHCKES
ncbi:hypothetical protein Tco_0667952 [Tanacetum coccineum]